jgi:hypothetical protein
MATKKKRQRRFKSVDALVKASCSKEVYAKYLQLCEIDKQEEKRQRELWQTEQRMQGVRD